MQNFLKTNKIIAVFFIIGVAFGVIANGKFLKSTQDTQNQSVVLYAQSLKANSSDTISFAGKTYSAQSGDLVTKKSGIVKRVLHDAGDFVRAGQVVAQIENLNETGLVTQARARLDAAKANLLKAENGASREDIEISNTAVNIAKDNLQNAKDALDTTLDSALSGVQNITLAIDNYFIDEDSATPRLTISIPAQYKLQIENARLNIKNDISALNTKVNYEEGVLHIENITDFVDLFLSAVKDAYIKDPLNSALFEVQNTLSQSKSSLISLKLSLQNAKSAYDNAKRNLDLQEAKLNKVLESVRNEDLLAARANVKLAEGSLQSALAALHNTYITSPISGRIESLSIKTGDFVPMFTKVGYVSGSDTLEIRGYVGFEIKEKLTVGSKAVVNDKYTATVTSISPGANGAGLYEVKLIMNKNDLPENTSVSVKISNLSEEKNIPDMIQIPVSAISFEGDKKYILISNGKDIKKIEPEIIQIGLEKAFIQNPIKDNGDFTYIILNPAKYKGSGISYDIKIDYE